MSNSNKLAAHGKDSVHSPVKKHPPFTFTQIKGSTNASVRSEGGDLFSFIMKLENIEFPEAVEFIAKRFNFQLSYDSEVPIWPPNP